jgi:hypothetical protein
MLDESFRFLNPTGIFVAVMPWGLSSAGLYPGHTAFYTDQWWRVNQQVASQFIVSEFRYRRSAFYDELPADVRKVFPFSIARNSLMNACDEFVIVAHPKKGYWPENLPLTESEYPARTEPIEEKSRLGTSDSGGKPKAGSRSRTPGRSSEEAKLATVSTSAPLPKRCEDRRPVALEAVKQRFARTLDRRYPPPSRLAVVFRQTGKGRQDDGYHCETGSALPGCRSGAKARDCERGFERLRYCDPDQRAKRGAGRVGQIVSRIDGAWVFLELTHGWLAGVRDENRVNVFDCAAWGPLAVAPAVRERLDAATSLFVDAVQGNDANSGRSPSAPLASLQAAIDLAARLDTFGYEVMIMLAVGTCDQTAVLRTLTGGGACQIVGDGASPGDVVLASSQWHTVSAAEISGYALRNLTIGSVYSGLQATGGSRLRLRKIRFAACGWAQIFCGGGSEVRVEGDYEIAGSAQHHLQAEDNSLVQVVDRAVTLTGAPAFSQAFALAARGSVLLLPGNAFNGASTGMRYTLRSNAMLETFGRGQD